MWAALVVQLRLLPSNAVGMGVIPGWGTKVPHAAECDQFVFLIH